LNDVIYWGTASAIVYPPSSFALVSGESTPQNIAADTSALYWTTAAGDVRTVTPPNTMASSLATARSIPSAITVYNGYVYWSEASSTQAGLGGQIVRTSASGGGPVQVLGCTTTVPIAIAVDTTSVYYATAAVLGAVDASCAPTGAIWSVPNPP
jgi:hypothetical protein